MGVLEQAQQGAGGGAVAPQLAEAAAAAGAPPPGTDTSSPAGPEAGAAPSPAGAAPSAAGAAPSPAGAAPSPAGAAAGPQGNPSEIMQKYAQQASPEEQQEYERAMRALVKVLYSNDDTANAIVDQVNPDDLVGSTSKVSMLFVKELDRKINMHEAVIASVTQEIVARVAELAEARHQVQYAPTDMEKIIGATWEGVQTMFGNNDQEGFAQTVKSMDPADLSTLKQQQDAILAQAQ